MAGDPLFQTTQRAPDVHIPAGREVEDTQPPHGDGPVVRKAEHQEIAAGCSHPGAL